MPFAKTYQSVKDMVNKYVDLYYQKVEANPRIRSTQHEHLNEIKAINTLYLECLEKQKQFNYEENKNQFIDKIDLLTKVFTTQAQQEERKKNKQNMLGKVKMY